MLQKTRFVMQRCCGIFRQKLLRNSCRSTGSVGSVQIRKEKVNDLSDSKCYPRGIVVGIFESANKTDDVKLTSAAELLDQKSDGRLMEIIRRIRFSGVVGSAKLLHNIVDEADIIAVVGLGQAGVGVNESECINEEMENVRVGAGIGSYLLQQQNCADVCVDGMGYPAQAAEGSLLSTWRFQEFLSEENRKIIPRLKLFGSGDASAWLRGVFNGEAQNIARTLCEMPKNLLTPTEFGEKVIDLLCPCGISVEIRDQDWMAAQRMDASLAVACTSCEPPVFLEINYRGGNSDALPILLVGNGITYDSGGLNLKSINHIHEMHGTMSSAATVVATMRAASQLQLPLNLIGIIPVCEHMTSGMSIRPSDVITLTNGNSIEVDKSIHAGMLTMADALYFACRSFKPQMILCVDTLTKDFHSVFGEILSPIFSNSKTAIDKIEECAVSSGDRVWHLPIWNYHRNRIVESSAADFSSVSCGIATSGKMVSFLQSITRNIELVYIDANGTGTFNAEKTLYPYLEEKRMTGRPVRTMIKLLEILSKSNVVENK